MEPARGLACSESGAWRTARDSASATFTVASSSRRSAAGRAGGRTRLIEVWAALITAAPTRPPRSPPTTLATRARSLHDRPDDPRRELFLAHTGELALAPLAGGDIHDLLEDLTPHRRKRRALENDAAVDVHVLFHVAVHQRVRRQLDGWDRLAAEHRAAPGGEADDVAAAGHEAGDRHGVVTRRVHEHEAARGDRLAVLEDVHHRRRAALGD